MGRTSSITVPSMVRIVGCAPVVDEKVLCFFYRQACAAMPVLFLLSDPKIGFFAPQGRHVALINVKFGTKVRSPVPNFTFSAAEMWEYSPKTVKISNFGHKFAPQGSLVCPIFTKFSDFVRVCRWILSFYFRDTNK